MAKQTELKNKMCKGNGQRENRRVWNNVQRVNHQNQCVPTAVLTRTCRIQVNTARTSGTNTVNTPWHNFNSQAVPTNAARKVNTVKPIVNNARPNNGFHKTFSPFRRPFNRTTALRTKFSNQKVNTAEVKVVSAVGEKRETDVKPSADPSPTWLGSLRESNLSYLMCRIIHKDLYRNKEIVDSGCSRYMTGNKAYLAEYQDYNVGPVAFGGSKGYITGKGKIKTRKLDFEDVCFVKELQHFNLFSVSQMCDKKNKVLFTDTECLVLSPDFKLPDENQVLLRVPRQNNMHSFNLENIVPFRGAAGNSEVEAESAQDYFVLPIWSSYTLIVKSSEAKNNGEKPQSVLLGFSNTKTSILNAVKTILRNKSDKNPNRRYCQYLGQRIYHGNARSRQLWLLLLQKQNMLLLATAVGKFYGFKIKKTGRNAEFHEIMDFLTRSSIYYALTISNTLLTARHVAEKPVTISDAVINIFPFADYADG
ncbi:hypothetical protein Tco_0163807 [Tanacetum coccineum]